MANTMHYNAIFGQEPIGYIGNIYNPYNFIWYHHP